MRPREPTESAEMAYSCAMHVLGAHLSASTGFVFKPNPLTAGPNLGEGSASGILEEMSQPETFSKGDWNGDFKTDSNIQYMVNYTLHNK